MKRSFAFSLVILVVALVSLPFLSGCGSTPAPTAAPTVAPTVVPATQVPPTQAPTAVPATATAVPPTPTTGPMVGGKIVIALPGEPDTLDVQKSASGLMSSVTDLMGGALVTRDPATGKIVPYLADSWKVSDDGLTIEFKLHAGVKFHDGNPLTAKDWVWTFDRAQNPATKSPGTAGFLAALDKAEAVDDATLRLHLKAPNFPLLTNLAMGSYLAPLSKAAVEKAGDNYGRNPVGVGPFKFKEWQTGTRIVLERNADYGWAPSFLHKGAPYIQTIEFVIIPEYATALAGVESGDIDYYGLNMGRVEAKDVQRLKDTGKVTIISTLSQSTNPCVTYNVSKAPFSDLKVRQALSYATDRNVMIQAVALGQAVAQHGPLTQSQSGYSADQEKVGYDLDVAKAKSLLKDAGWVAGSDGMLSKDGQPFKVTLKTTSEEAWQKVAQIIQEQWKAVGIAIEIQQTDNASLVGAVVTGDYQASVMGFGLPDADILVMAFGSANIQGMDLAKANDADLDTLLQATRTTMDVDKRQAAVNAAVSRIMGQAYLIPLYVPQVITAANNRVKGLNYSEKTLVPWFNDAYVTK